MRKFLSILGLPTAVLAVALLVVGAANSIASNPFHGADIYGVGAGQRAGPGGGTTRFDLSAHMGAPGQPDFGHVAATNDLGNFDVYVDVDCVKVFGLTGNGGAWISGIVRRVTPVPNILGVGPGDRETFLANDGGEPSAGVVDAFYFDLGETVNCKLLPPATFPPNVTQGNIRIDLG
jgi:hypothetical protein